jgi:hypothetical protein
VVRYCISLCGVCSVLDFDGLGGGGLLESRKLSCDGEINESAANALYALIRPLPCCAVDEKRDELSAFIGVEVDCSKDVSSAIE